MDETFDLSWCDAEEGRDEDLRRINTVIARLADRRRSKIERVGPLAQSKLA